ncbi:MAG: adenine phosphoribosyltransferase [Candidatus Binatia bacterium]
MNLKDLVRDIPDHPKPGVNFKDITPVLSDSTALRWLVDALADRYRGRVDAVVGIESRGFIAGAPVAYALGTGLVVVRKPGKLPYETRSVSYELEYGTDSLEMHVDAVHPGQRVVVIDDLLATGGTACACIELLQANGAEVVECGFVFELAFLGGAARLAPVPSFALVSYES